MKLADPALLKKPVPRRRRLGRRRGRSDPEPRDRRADRKGSALRLRRDRPRDRGGGKSLRPLGEDAPQGAGQHPAPLVRPHRRQPRRSRPHHDERAGQAAGRGARRDRLRRRLRRVLRRGGEAHLRRDQPDLSRRFAHPRHPAADRRRGGDHPVEFSRRDDHPQGRPRPGRRLHGGGQAGRADAADRAGAGRTRRPRRLSARRPQRADGRLARDRQGDVRASRGALRRLHRLDGGRQAPHAPGGGNGEEGRARARRQCAVHRVRRRRRRRRGRGGDRVEVPQHGPDLRLRQPHLRAGRDLRRFRRKTH